MTLVPTIPRIEYPETDGKPMGETDVHRNWMIRIFDLLSQRYRDQRVYVSCNLMIYYQEGAPHRSISPDGFVVLDADPGERRVFKIWEEGKGPDVVFEVTSKSTQRRDTVTKPRIYARIGVKEYFLYDPTGEYLTPPLRGFRLVGTSYVELKPDESDALVSRSLGLSLRLEAGRLVILDRRTGQPLRTKAETEQAAREAEQRARVAAETRAEAEIQARQAAEREVQRLREQLQRLGGEPGR